MLNLFKKKHTKNFFLKDNLKKEININLAEVGDWSYGNPKIYRWDYISKIKIGKFCSLGPDVKLLIGGGHQIDWITTSPLSADTFNNSFPNCSNIKNFAVSKGDLIIENDVWIGAFATIFNGITIGNGSVIGAGAVITKDVSPYSVVIGNPQKEIKKRFSKKKIKILEESKWWELNNNQLNEISPYLLSENFDGFISTLKKIKL
jgi:acetyltransferase-like isoleucine patch superfamily enzyme